MSFDEIVVALMSSYGLGRKQACDDLNQVIEEWITQGLLAEESFEFKNQSGPEALPLTQEDYFTTPPPMPAEWNSFTFSLVERVFRLRCADKEIWNSIIDIFGHLVSSSLKPSVFVDLVESAGRCWIYCDGTPIVHDIPREHSIGRLTQEVLRIAYKQCHFLIAVHGAVLSSGKQCILLSGQSGSGKSTLTAALLKDGFGYFTDDVALVDRSTRNIIPIPVSLRLKEGSWEAVSAIYSDFAGRPWHWLPLGEKVRYLPPPHGRFASRLSDGFPVRWIIFPEYSPDKPSASASISRVEALDRLQLAGYDTGGYLDRTKIVELLAWMKTIDCYEMEVGRLDEAVKIVRGLTT